MDIVTAKRDERWPIPAGGEAQQRERIAERVGPDRAARPVGVAHTEVGTRARRGSIGGTFEISAGVDGHRASDESTAETSRAPLVDRRDGKSLDGDPLAQT